MAGRDDRKQRGAWYTPPWLVDSVIDAVVTDEFVHRARGRRIRVLDPACGDGRFLGAAARRAADLGADVELVGVDIDPSAGSIAMSLLPTADIVVGDALEYEWGSQRFDLVIGNPPFLSQLATATSRGGAGRRGGGPYADAAVQFLALGAELVDQDGGRLAMVLPQSVLSSRDAAPVRAAIDAVATMWWSSWTGERVFDAQVHTCVVAFEFGRPAPRKAAMGDWSSVVTGPGGIPALPTELRTAGTLGHRARLNANFRDEYYGLIPAVADDADGPRLVTSGLIDPGVSAWGSRPVTFAKRRIERPRVALDRLDDRMQRWAHRRLVPKVLVANQTSIIEAVADADGEWLPGVPVVSVYPTGTHWEDELPACSKTAVDAVTVAVWEIAAVLTSPLASAWLWHRSAGTGLSASSVRASPTVLADLPWPDGDLSAATDALRTGDVRGCARAVHGAYGIEDRSDLTSWWVQLLERIETRQAVAP